mgnify:CR=1 FL=1
MPSESRSRITLKTRRLIAENQVFDVYFDHIVEDGGAEVPAYLVVAPKAVSEDLVTGASVLPVMEGRIGLLRLYRHAIGELTWEVPRGFVEAGESPGDAAARELEEEAGLIVDKDNAPRWNPPSLTHVTDASVEAFFAPRWKPPEHPLRHL